MQNQERYEHAKKRAEAKYGFFVHLGVFLAVNLLLAIINLSNMSEGLWFVYPLMGWGIGLFFHALGVFLFEGKREMVTEKMIQKEMNKASFR
ncbi:MAG: 2TM domain-containing protein [Pyrinomonadaceae bacterium]|nr:2TM domain-containing protein [Pyrinomonadaceae bacterium]